MISFAATIITLQLFAQPCDLLTVNCGATQAMEFMPSSGRLVADEESSVGGKFLFVAFRWDSEERMIAM